MHYVAPLMPRTPRSVKRFVNVYRIYKSGLSTEGLARFLGTEEQPGNFRAVQVLLALSTGSPQLGKAVFFELLIDPEKDRRLRDLVGVLLDQNNSRWKTTLAALYKFVKVNENNMPLSDLRTVAPLVSRYSVHHMVSETPGETALG